MPIAPVSTTNRPAGYKLAAATLSNATPATFDVDYSGKLGGRVQIVATYPAAVSATSGVQVDIFPLIGSNPDPDTVSILPGVVPAVVSTTQRRSFAVGTGRYRFKLTNLDTVSGNAPTVSATEETVDGVQQQ